LDKIVVFGIVLQSVPDELTLDTMCSLVCCNEFERREHHFFPPEDKREEGKESEKREEREAREEEEEEHKDTRLVERKCRNQGRNFSHFISQRESDKV